MIVDIHSHLDSPHYDDDRDAVIDRAKSAGVSAIITSGINKESNRQALELSRRYDIVKAALGIYPIDALKKEIEGEEFNVGNSSFDIDEEIDFIRKNSADISAISEIGLDFVDSTEEEKASQIELFRKMLDLAIELKLPAIVHTRKAEAEAVDIMKEYRARHKNLNIVLHCFMGKKKLIEECYRLGFYFSIPCNIVRAQNFQMTVSMVDINRLFIETDGPYMSPFKDTRNEPAFLIEAIKKIAELKGMTEDEVIKNLYMNYQRIF